MRAKRVFILGNFPDLSLSTLTRTRYYWIKGLLRIGCDVRVFSYRNMMVGSNPFRSLGLARLFARCRVNTMLSSQIKAYCPDIVLLLGTRVKDLSDRAITAVREAAPGAVFAAIEYDWLPELDGIRRRIGARMDVVICVAGGSFLSRYKAAGAKRCAYMPWPCDPDLQLRYSVGPEWQSDILFTGRLNNPKIPSCPERHAILTRLAERPGAKLYGCHGRPAVSGLDYFRAISGARIALSINMVNDVRLYHSNRFINNIACGAFTLARRVPDTDLLFQDKVHVRYFEGAEEFSELARWYLAHDEERERIARAETEHAHREFNCQRMARHLLDLVEKGRIDAPWAEILRQDK